MIMLVSSGVGLSVAFLLAFVLSLFPLVGVIEKKYG